MVNLNNIMLAGSRQMQQITHCPTPLRTCSSIDSQIVGASQWVWQGTMRMAAGNGITSLENAERKMVVQDCGWTKYHPVICLQMVGLVLYEFHLS